MADGLHEVGLAEGGGPVDEEGIVDGTGRLGDGAGGGMGEAVAGADDELLERVLGVEVGPRGDAGAGGGPGRRMGGGCGFRGRGGPGLLVRSLHDILDARVGWDADGTEGVLDETPVVGADPVAEEVVAQAEDENVLGVARRPDVGNPSVVGVLAKDLL